MTIPNSVTTNKDTFNGVSIHVQQFILVPIGWQIPTVLFITAHNAHDEKKEN